VPWHGLDRLAEVPGFEVEAARKPVVGLSPRTTTVMREFVREEGFVVEVSEDRERFGAYLDLPPDEISEMGILAHLESAPGPLVRLWRWPAGARSALALTGDIDSITLQDFALRLWETRW
jgi:hypothetical protein